MTDPVQEQLSACLDNELPEAELDLLLKRLGRDPQLGEPMGRYAVIREALRDERPARASADFASRVSAAIAAEQTVPRRPARFSRDGLKWLRPAAGMAIAAGVAAIAVVTVQPRIETPQQVADAEMVAASPAVPTAQADDSASYIVPTMKATTAFIPATRLTNYVVAHSEYATPLGRRMVLNGVLAEDDTLTEEADPASASPVDISIQQP